MGDAIPYTDAEIEHAEAWYAAHPHDDDLPALKTNKGRIAQNQRRLIATIRAAQSQIAELRKLIEGRYATGGRSEIDYQNEIASMRTDLAEAVGVLGEALLSTTTMDHSGVCDHSVGMCAVEYLADRIDAIISKRSGCVCEPGDPCKMHGSGSHEQPSQPTSPTRMCERGLREGTRCEGCCPFAATQYDEPPTPQRGEICDLCESGDPGVIFNPCASLTVPGSFHTPNDETKEDDDA